MQGVAGLRKLLEVLNEGPQEVVGVQHLLLQLQCVQEWLCLQEKGWERDRDWTALEEKFRMISALDGWFAQGLERVRRNGDHALLTLLTDALQGMRSVAQGSPAILKRLLQAAGDSDWRVRKAAVSALGQLAAAAPSLAPATLERLLQAAGDSDWNVREAAVSALGQVVAAAPSLAPATLQPLLTAVQDFRFRRLQGRHLCARAGGRSSPQPGSRHPAARSFRPREIAIQTFARPLSLRSGRW